MLWCEDEVCEERAADGVTVTRRPWGLGEQDAGVPRFFGMDHLGSVGDVTNNASVLAARYTFDPWGRRTLSAGNDVTAIGYTGQRHHSAGVSLTLYRAYDSQAGRWASEDPARFVDGPNLYSYVNNNPIRFVDPDGRMGQTAVILVCSPDPITKLILAGLLIITGVVVIVKACEGGCFRRKEDECYDKCAHLLPSPSGDRQASEYTKCYRECMGRL